MNIPFSRPGIAEKELACVADVLRSGRLTLGRVAEFERRFAAFVGARCAIAVSSGTSALHLCVRALGIGAGDEVITMAPGDRAVLGQKGDSNSWRKAQRWPARNRNL